jgi:HlyD family secretion protein
MDVVRKTKRPIWLKRRSLVLIIGSGLVASALFGYSRFKPALPVIDRDRIVLGTVKRGVMLRNVRGSGRLVSEDVTVITSETGGRVKEVAVQAGAEVKQGARLLLLENPNVEKSLMDARLSLRATEANLLNMQVQIEQEQLDVKAATARAVAAHEEATLQFKIDDELWKNGLIAMRQHRLSRSRADQAMNLRDIQLERVRLSKQTTEEELAIQKQRVAVARHYVELQETAVASLEVLAKVDGVVQQIGPSARVPLDIGQQVGIGATMGIISNPSRLKAELEIPQSQAQDIVVGQLVNIEAVSSREGISGQVSRVDPKVQEGTVTVEVKLSGQLPKGTRPDLSVYGTVEIERLENALYMERPMYGQAGSSANLFRLSKEGDTAVRTPVKLGRSSTLTIELLQGLQEGDRVILSDMSSWSSVERLAIR